jgi:hypothetical protein
MIYLEPKDLPSQLRPLHDKGPVRVSTVTQVTVPMDAGLWSGGTRDVYTAVVLATGQTQSLTTFSAPWSEDRFSRTYTLSTGFAVARTGSFCGKPAGLHLYIHPSDAWPALAAPEPELSRQEQVVLQACAGYKSSYRSDFYRRQNVQTSEVEQATAKLVSLGYLKPRGGVTPAGRNRRNTLPPMY